MRVLIFQQQFTQRSVFSTNSLFCFPHPKTCSALQSSLESYKTHPYFIIIALHATWEHTCERKCLFKWKWLWHAFTHMCTLSSTPLFIKGVKKLCLYKVVQQTKQNCQFLNSPWLRKQWETCDNPWIMYSSSYVCTHWSTT